MAKGPSPLLGYNTNVEHKGKIYHIQTEDSGINHPHVITHLFADGGRIVATKKTDYAQYIGSENFGKIVKLLMQKQHKTMFIELRDGVHGEEQPAPQPVRNQLTPASLVAEPPIAPSTAPTPSYQPTVAAGTNSPERNTRPESMFGADVLSEKSLDEVILAYLAEDVSE